MVERAPGVTRLLDRLEAKRLVTRERCPRDRRQVLCRISRGGLALLARLDRPMQRGTGAALGALPGRDLGSLVRLLDAVRASRGRRPGAVARMGRGRETET
jgi:DNA-binding MarR family transcriptional regulator